MRVGVPKEIKTDENRVGMVPSSVRELVHHGHTVVVETNAGTAIGVSDADYENAGAKIATTAKEVFATADMIVKVKEPQAEERAQLRPGQILFTYLHLAPDPDQTRDLVKSSAVCIAYETVTSPLGGLPLLAPMSEVAGRMSIQAGAHCLEKKAGGRGVLLSGVTGVPAAKVVVLGGGVVGTNAIFVALGMGADVVVLDRNVNVLRRLIEQFGPSLKTEFSTTEAVTKHVLQADLVIGGVLIPGAAAPRLVTKDMLKRMQPGSVMVDVSIDQGGCFETSRPTTHSKPTYVVDNVLHYCVANMPGAVPRTSTFALNNVTLPFALAIADKGYQKALLDDPHLRAGLNVCRGKVTNKPVAEALQYPFVDPSEALAA